VEWEKERWSGGEGQTNRRRRATADLKSRRDGRSCGVVARFKQGLIALPRNQEEREDFQAGNWAARLDSGEMEIKKL
jgi:hypothetical protein